MLRHSSTKTRLKGGVPPLFMLGITRENEVEQVQKEIKQEDVKHSNLDFLLLLTIKTMVILDWLLHGVVSGINGWEIKKLQLLH